MGIACQESYDSIAIQIRDELWPHSTEQYFLNYKDNSNRMIKIKPNVTIYACSREENESCFDTL